MRKLVYFIASTLDGFIAGPDGADPTGPDGFWPIPEDYVAHLIAEYPETLPGPARAALSITAEGTHFDTVVEGRRSYEVGIAAGVTDAYPHLRHLVFSRTLGESPDPAVEIVATDPVARVRELKQEDGKDIWLVGGGELAGSLYPEIDTLIVKLSPMTIGAGIPLFSHKATFDPNAWTLTGNRILDSGALFLTYERATTTVGLTVGD
ncbi:dihydrofolate reductase [Streptomyces sp. P01-B04]|uniref:dihydrofolate reductase family protein n=1 Tax=Streptomyces TaxID=1883 RepID=UPI001C5E16BC|nr:MULTISPECIES: dihydrofolate reductase family protein [Streptomyces]MBW5251931.1 dihydrofolate reductase [Streptomyces poriferorum]MBW5258570.1 dihydrofolate reductase [Streptomyces poriferorum]WSI63362.1 dihydrofolate reductase family protein [Streptomyces sp. NBC_01336]